VDLLVAPAPGATEAIVERIVHLGFEVRIELATGDGRPLFAQLTRPELDQLELAEGQILYVRPRQPLVAVAV
jgi:sulfate transport system ATP-binding protein